MVTHGRVELLAHPLSQKYLQMKWNAYGKYFHVTNLLIYTVFLSFVTIYASHLMQSADTNEPNINNNSSSAKLNFSGEVSSLNLTVYSKVLTHFFSLFLNIFLIRKFLLFFVQPQAARLVHSRSVFNQADISSQAFIDKQINVTTIMMVSGIAIMIYVVCSTLREFLQIWQQKSQYIFEPINFISWTLYISAGIMVSPIINGGWIADVHFSATSLAVFLSWFNLLLFLQRFDQVSRKLWTQFYFHSPIYIFLNTISLFRLAFMW